MRKVDDYQPLVDFLASSDADEVHLSLTDLEQLLGWSLPYAAYTTTWWGNTRTTLRGRAWLDAGWRVDARGIRSRLVSFTRLHGQRPT